MGAADDDLRPGDRRAVFIAHRTFGRASPQEDDADLVNRVEKTDGAGELGLLTGAVSGQLVRARDAIVGIAGTYSKRKMTSGV